MARIIASKYPIDSIGRKAVGFSLPFNGPAVFNPTFTTREQTKSNLINYLLTNRGERVFNPNVVIKEIQFDNQPDNNEINFTLTYQIQNFDINDEINILLQ